MKASTSAKATISSNLRAISRRDIPRMAPLRYTLSRPVSSGWNPVPTSSNPQKRPVMTARPFVGSVTRERIFSRVLLPEPLLPITPNTSPFLISNDTSRSAQRLSVAGEPAGQGRLRGLSRPQTIPLRQVLDSYRSVTHSDHIGEGALHPPKKYHAAPQQHRDRSQDHRDHADSEIAH